MMIAEELALRPEGDRLRLQYATDSKA